MRYNNTIESHKQHLKNLSNEQLTDEQITLLPGFALPGFKIYPYTRNNRNQNQARTPKRFWSLCETNAPPLHIFIRMLYGKKESHIFFGCF